MQVSFAAATSGIQTVLTREDVSANNIANSTTPGFSQTDTYQSSMSPQGVQISGFRQTPNLDPANSNTDLNKEMINQVQNKNELAADVSVIKTQDKMIGALLDIVA